MEVIIVQSDVERGVERSGERLVMFLVLEEWIRGEDSLGCQDRRGYPDWCRIIPLEWYQWSIIRHM